MTEIKFFKIFEKLACYGSFLTEKCLFWAFFGILGPFSFKLKPDFKVITLKLLRINVLDMTGMKFFQTFEKLACYGHFLAKKFLFCAILAVIQHNFDCIEASCMQEGKS